MDITKLMTNRARDIIWLVLEDGGNQSNDFFAKELKRDFPDTDYHDRKEAAKLGRIWAVSLRVGATKKVSDVPITMVSMAAELKSSSIPPLKPLNCKPTVITIETEYRARVAAAGGARNEIITGKTARKREVMAA